MQLPNRNMAATAIFSANLIGRAAARIVVAGCIGVVCTQLILARPAGAAADVQGAAEDIQLRLESASVREVLDALARKFKLTYTLTSLPNRQMTGRYTGTLSG